MHKPIKLNKKQDPLLCERCGLRAAKEMYVIDFLLYCEECKKILDRAKAVEEFDTD